MNKPRILFTAGIFPPALGGPGTVLVNLIPKLIDQGYNCSVSTFGQDDKVDRGYPIFRTLLSTPQPAKTWAVFKQIYTLAKKHDIIYTLDTYTHGLSSLLAAKILGKPLILRFTGDSAWETAFNHGLTRDDVVTFQKKYYGPGLAVRKWFKNRICHGADRIITDCQFLKNLLGVVGIKTDKITVINNATKPLPELDGFNAQSFKTESNLGDKIIFTQSRLVPWKGIKALIEIMPDILREFPNTSLVIMGDGPQEDVLKSLTKEKGLEKNVKFLGKVVDKRAKKEIYNITDVFVLNTFYEGMSNVLLEAMAAGCAVITTRAGGNEEFVNSENGILVDYDNNQQIRESVLKLLSNPELSSKLGAKAKKTASLYTWDNLAAKNTKLIDEIWEKQS